MKNKFILTTIFLFALHFLACNKEKSDSENKNNHGTLPSNYPFADGFCEGTSLGVPITDTSFFTTDTTMSLPNSLLLDMPTPGDQGIQSSCTAWATIYGVGSYYDHLKTGKPYSDTGNLSPKFTYNQITQGNCTCTSFLDNLYLLRTQGACSLSTMPYDPGECSRQPDSLQKSNAQNYTISDWRKIDLHNTVLIKRAILEKKPVLFAINPDNGFNSLASPYIWQRRIGSIGQPHAMIIIGYDDNIQAFRIMNSWSTAWGDNGFAWIDYDFFVKNVLEGGYVVI